MGFILRSTHPSPAKNIEENVSLPSVPYRTDHVVSLPQRGPTLTMLFSYGCGVSKTRARALVPGWAASLRKELRAFSTRERPNAPPPESFTHSTTLIFSAFIAGDRKLPCWLHHTRWAQVKGATSQAPRPLMRNEPPNQPFLFRGLGRGKSPTVSV